MGYIYIYIMYPKKLQFAAYGQIVLVFPTRGYRPHQAGLVPGSNFPIP